MLQQQSTKFSTKVQHFKIIYMKNKLPTNHTYTTGNNYMNCLENKCFFYQLIPQINTMRFVDCNHLHMWR